MSTLDLSIVPLPDLFAEIDRRELSLHSDLRAIGEWRNSEHVPQETMAAGNRIVAEVSRKSRVPVDAIMGRRRDYKTSRARMICMVALFREIGNTTLTARFFRRDRVCIIHALKTIDSTTPNLNP